MTKPGASGRQVLFHSGATTRWIELRGTPGNPYLARTPGVVPHAHNSSSIRRRIDMDHGTEADVLERYAALIDDLMNQPAPG